MTSLGSDKRQSSSAEIDRDDWPYEGYRREHMDRKRVLAPATDMSASSINSLPVPNDDCCRIRVTKFCLKTMGVMSIFIFGVALLLSGVFSRKIETIIVDSQLKQNIRLDNPDLEYFKGWIDPSESNVTIYMQIVLWNITNPIEVMGSGALPKLELIGPWTYTEKILKHDILFSEDRDVVYYKYNRTFHYYDKPCPKGANISTMCSLPENLMFYTMNTPYIGVVNQLSELLRDKPVLAETLMGVLKLFSKEQDEKSMMHKSMKDIVFGYDDKILTLINQLAETALKLGVKLDLTIPSGGYNLLNNNSLPEMFNSTAVYTGRKNMSNLNKFISWAGQNKSLNVWNGCTAEDAGGSKDLADHYNKLANMINGTDGTLVHPHVHSDESLYMFSDDLQVASRFVSRTANGTYPEWVDYKGVKLMRYRLDGNILKSKKEIPMNCAYQNNGPTGVMNMSLAYGSSVYTSKPYFMDGSASYFANVTNFLPPGVTPETRATPRDDYDTFVDVEPNSGIVYGAHKRLQVNVRLEQHEANSWETRNIHPGGFLQPVMYCDEWTEAPSNMVQQYKESLGVIEEVQNIYHLAGPIVGCLLIVVSALLARKLGQSKTQKMGMETRPLI
eukprot:m.40628 g.40628  ORF g.40628 m.40628 type:complete len:615 (+) comp9688_c0_seq1:225-2069(+)